MRKLAAAFAACVTVLTLAVAGPLAGSASAFGPCSNPTAIEDPATGLFVTADDIHSGTWYEGMLRARSPEVGQWQIFIGCIDDRGEIALWSAANELWVTPSYWVGGAGHGLLIADSTTVGEPQEFSCYVTCEYLYSQYAAARGYGNPFVSPVSWSEPFNRFLRANNDPPYRWNDGWIAGL